MEMKQDHDENSSSTWPVLGCGRSNTRHEYVSSNHIVLSCNINPSWLARADTEQSFMPPTHSETLPVVAGTRIKKISTEELDNNITTNVGKRKKLRLTKEQSYLLEVTFRERSTINLKQKQVLAEQLNLRPRQIEVWFQNRRARAKLKQTEMHYEVLKRHRESLTEENMRLQTELTELKKSTSSTAVVFSSSEVSHTLTKLVPLQRSVAATATFALCPSCQRIAHDRYAPAQPKTLSRRALPCLPFVVQ